MEQQAEPTDIFAWANNVTAIADVVDVDLFLFNKKFTVYEAQVAQELQRHLKELFFNELVKYVVAGPDKGMMVRTFEEAEAEDLVIQRTELGNVENAAHVLQQIEEPTEDLVLFNDEEHDFKRIKGMVARFSHATLDKPFYIIKLVQQSQVLKAKTAWLLQGSLFQPFPGDAGLKVLPDNQVLIVNEDIFVFHQRKFENLFGYNAKQQYIARQKVAEIERNFKLSFPEGSDMNMLVKDKRGTIKKLQTLEITGVTQDQLLEHAEDMGVELLLDDDGSIIIMDGKDLDTFVNLLNDDYVESNLTGRKYEIRSKKALEPSE